MSNKLRRDALASYNEAAVADMALKKATQMVLEQAALLLAQWAAA